MPPSLRRRLLPALRVAGGLTGAAFLVVAFLETWDRSEGLPLPGVPALLGAFALVVVGLVVAVRAWTALLGDVTSRQVARGFYAAQLGKYVPGAVWQAVGQVDAAWRLGVSLPRAATAFGVWTVTQVAGSAALGVLLVLWPVPVPIRVGAGAAAVLVVFLDRRWMGWVLTRLGRTDGALPASGQIRRAWLLGLVPQATGGAAFALLLAATGAGFLPVAVPAAIVAWTAGFLALPFPSGLGVREAVLLLALGSWADAPLILAASLALRLVTIVAEVVLVLATRVPGAAAPAGAVPQRGAVPPRTG